MARTGFYPGSFDPVTYGHLDIIARSARLVDKLVLGVGVHHGKQALIAAETRIALLETGHPAHRRAYGRQDRGRHLRRPRGRCRAQAPCGAHHPGPAGLRPISTTRSRWAR